MMSGKRFDSSGSLDSFELHGMGIVCLTLHCSNLDHPNVVGLKGFCLDPVCVGMPMILICLRDACLKLMLILLIVMEWLAAGTLTSYLADYGDSIDWSLRLCLCLDIARGTLPGLLPNLLGVLISALIAQVWPIFMA